MLQFDVPDQKKIRVIIDTDTACEADDPFAIAYALMSPRLLVKAIVAEHFCQPGSMVRSYQAAQRVTQAMNSSVPVLHGEIGPEESCEPSEGVQFIVREARREDAHPLYLLCMGALTNIARALTEAPDIAEKVTIVVTGGHDYRLPQAPWREFNFGNDVKAANTVLQSNAVTWQIPANVYGSIRVGLAELQEQVKPYGGIGRYLFRQMTDYNMTPEAWWNAGESWSLGDSPSVAAVLHQHCGNYVYQKVRKVNDDTGYSPIGINKDILVYQDFDSRYLLGDFYAKLHLLFPKENKENDSSCL